MTIKKYTVEVQKIDDECFIELPDEVLESAGFKIGDLIKWTDNGDGSWTMTKSDDMNYYVVEVLSTFKNTYIVKAKSKEHALDETSFKVDTDIEFVEFSQKHLGTQILGGRVITEDEIMTLHQEENSYINNWSKEQVMRLTNEIKYEDDNV